jgi:autotransporter passenger strand-loop-strand repeat protein
MRNASAIFAAALFYLAGGSANAYLAYEAPPDRNGLVVNFQEVFVVNIGGTADNTTITRGGTEIVYGKANHTTVSGPGADETVDDGGLSDNTTINSGGTEYVSGLELHTTINDGGHLTVFSDGTVKDVVFGGPNALVRLYLPRGIALLGSIQNWQVSDVIEFTTKLTGVEMVGPYGDTVGVFYNDGPTKRETDYFLINQQANTQFKLQSNDLGGTSLILVPIVGGSSAAVPEPSTWAMMLLGFAGLGFVGYRQATRSAKPQAA